MKRITVAVTVVFLLAACSALPSIPSITQPTANVDVAATSQAELQISVAQTLTAQPTLTSAPVTDTATLPIESPTLSATDTPLPTDSPVPNLTTTPATATGGPDSAAAAPVRAAGQVTPTWTLAVRTYGTLPPKVPFAHITLINRAKAEAYISLHVDLDGSNTVIEYPVKGTIVIEAPLGSYRYVAWVGGREMIGEFKLHNSDDLTITLYKDRIVIK
jgi:hypothetical protein